MISYRNFSVVIYGQFSFFSFCLQGGKETRNRTQISTIWLCVFQTVEKPEELNQDLFQFKGTSEHVQIFYQMNIVTLPVLLPIHIAVRFAYA